MAHSQKAFLHMSQGQRFLLDHPTISIGRDPKNSIAIPDVEASRLHAQIQRKNDCFRLIDLDSANGLFVNQARVREAVLQHADVIRIGKTVFRFELETTGSYSDSNVLVDDSRDSRDSRDSAIEPRLVPIQEGLDVFFKISQAISRTPDLDDLLKKILQVIFKWTHADRACILLNEDSDYRVVSSIDKKGDLNERINISRTILNLAGNSLEAVMVSGDAEDQHLRQAKSLVSSGINELVCVPIAYHDQLRGFIYVDTIVGQSSHIFREEHVKLMAAVGQQVAVAIENHLHYSKVMETRQSAAVGEAMIGLSHHIKNILQGIQGGAHIIDSELADKTNTEETDLIKKGWEIVKRNQDKISELVLDMISFGDAQDLDLRRVDLNAVIEKLVRRLRAETEDKAIVFDWTPSPSVEPAIADRKSFTRVIENVVRNAIDACRKKGNGNISIRLEQVSTPSEIRVVIQDNGCGIAQKNLPNIFSLFESTKGGRSTGIGLTVAQKLIRELHGEISVVSTEGVGSKFTIALPHTNHKETMKMKKIKKKN